MKRFVTELANHALKPYEKHPEKHPEIWSEIGKAVVHCERGYITEIEAADYIIRAVKKEEGRA